MQPAQHITVRVLKHDGVEYRRWKARVASKDGSLLVLDAEFEFDVEHDLIGSIKRGTRTIEYYWLDRWYNVFRFLDADESTRLYYCNISTPPVIENDLLTYVDLDIDILVRPDFSFEVLDLEEFEMNAGHYGYSEEEKRRTQSAVAELISLIQNRQFPFARTNKSAPVYPVVIRS